MERLIVLRHAHARSNTAGCVSGRPPGEGLSVQGEAEARAAAAAVAALGPSLGVASRFARTQETLALAAPGLPTFVLPALDEIAFGRFEGGSLEAYRTWAWSAGPAEPCPGGGESRADAAVRLGAALEALLALPHAVVLAVSHSMPLRYVLDAAEGRAPACRVEPVAHVQPQVLEAEAVARAAALLRSWAAAPVFRDAPDGA